VTDEMETVWKVVPGISQELSRSLLRSTGDELAKHQNPRCTCRNLKKTLPEQGRPDSSVGIATSYGLDGLGIEFRRG
jgi:hypothetical protein